MAEDAKEAPAKPKSKKMLIIVLAVLLLVGGGAGGWFFMKRGGDHEVDTHAAEEAKRKKDLKARVFVNLEPFTVNLADDEDRFAQVAVVLEVVNAEAAEDIKSLMPAVRNRVLLLLSSKHAADLLSLEGKEKLAVQIAEATAKAVGWVPPKASSKKKKKKKVEEDDDEESDDEAEPPRAPAKPATIAGPVTGVNFSQFIVQ